MRDHECCLGGEVAEQSLLGQGGAAPPVDGERTDSLLTAEHRTVLVAQGGQAGRRHLDRGVGDPQPNSTTTRTTAEQPAAAPTHAS